MLPAVRSGLAEHQRLKLLLHEIHHLRRAWGDGRVPAFRWVPQLAYEDSAGRCWKVNALECTETTAAGGRQYFAGLTPLPVNRRTVEEVAPKGGR